VFACGRYEGIDARVAEHYRAQGWPVSEVSLGDYVLNGGEVAALAMIESVVRLLPGVLGNPDSLIEESHTDGLLEYPNYTRPASWRGLDVPPVLLGGNHAEIAQWRRAESERLTRERRPDLRGSSLRLIGYWEGPQSPGWPNVEHFVDEMWDTSEREIVAQALDRGLYFRGYMGYSNCRLCGKLNGTSEYTDGVYVWPEGLSHYVRKHHVRLPDEFVRHVFESSGMFDDDTSVDVTWWLDITQE